MSQLCIDFPASGGLITNYHCVSRCNHCLYNCSPHRSRDYIDSHRAEKIFRSILGFGCRSVHIGDGEPLLAPDKLIAVAAAARRAGMKIDYVETNSAWFIDAPQATAVTKDLRAAGVEALLVSVSPFHNAHIPFIHPSGPVRRPGHLYG